MRKHVFVFSIYRPLASKTSRGFSLPELLIAGIIAALLTVVTAQVMMGQLFEGRRLEQAQRLRENASRLNYLIQIEASESDEIDDSLGLEPACTGAGAADIVTFWVPRTDGPYADDANRSAIQYYNSGTDIWRCGPRVTQNGVLNPDAGFASGPVLRNAQLVIDDQGCTETTNPRQLSYSIDFPTSLVNAGDSAVCVVAHARSTFVCNPPLLPADPATYVPLVGDCELPPASP